MAINCDGLDADIINDCNDKSSAGLEVNVVIIKREDIDYAASTYDEATGTITTLICKTGKTGYALQGINEVLGASSELVPKEDSFDKHKHLFSGVILYPSAINKRLANNLTDDLYVVTVEKLYKGLAMKDAFEVLGWDSGLVISTLVWNTKESDGVIKFELASEDGYEEPEMTCNNLELGTYAATKTAFEEKYATV